MLFPGTCCHFKANFEGVIPLLAQNFQVVCVSYDGFDDTEETIFPDMITETEKIEDYIMENCGGSICAAYGCSLGGSFVGLLIQRGRVHIAHGLIGSSDLDQAGKLTAKLQAVIVTKVFYKILHTGELPKWMKKIMNKKADADMAAYADQMLSSFFGIGTGGRPYIQKQSIYNQFYSDLVTPLEDKIHAPGTTIHCFYAVKMGEKYLARYEQHFENPDIRRHDLQHEELLCRFPEKWAEEVRDCCGIS